jgi:hypothetical protein
VRREQWLDAQPGRHPRQGHPTHQGHRGDQPEQPDRRPVLRCLLRGIIEIAREFGLVIFADEVYDKVLYDGARHTAIGSLSD